MMRLFQRSKLRTSGVANRAEHRRKSSRLRRGGGCTPAIFSKRYIHELSQSATGDEEMGKNAPEPNWLEREIPNSENARSSTQQFGNTEVSLLIPLITTHLQLVVFCTQSISGAYFRMLKCFTLVKLPRLPFLSISTQFRLYSVKSIILHRVHAWHRKKKCCASNRLLFKTFMYQCAKTKT